MGYFLSVLLILVICIPLAYGIHCESQRGSYRVQKHTDENNNISYEVRQFNSEKNDWKFCLKSTSEAMALSLAEKLRNEARERKEKLKNVNDVTIKKFKP